MAGDANGFKDSLSRDRDETTHSEVRNTHVITHNGRLVGDQATKDLRDEKRYSGSTIDDSALHRSACFTSNRLENISKELPKHVRKYYKKQNSVIDAYEQIQLQEHDDGDSDSDQRVIRLASIMSKVTFALNLVLLVAKCVAVGLSGSLVIISSMLDSAMDLVSGALMWWSNRAIKRTNYYFYPRGRRKLEPVAIVVLAVIMSFVSVQVIHESIQKIVIYTTHGYDDQLWVADSWLSSAANLSGGVSNDVGGASSNATSAPGESELSAANMTATAEVVQMLRDTLDGCSRNHGAPVFELPTIIICIATIVTKLILFLVCRRIDNPSIQALAKDHFNDVISNTGAITCGIIGYHLWKYADPLGAIVISISIIINWSITARDQIKLLTGYTARPHFLNKITWIAVRHDDRIRCIERVIAFHFGVRFLVEVHIVLPAEMSMRVAHDLSEALQLKIEHLPEVERAFVHTDYECDWLERPSSSTSTVTVTMNGISDDGDSAPMRSRCSTVLSAELADALTAVRGGHVDT